MNAAGASGGRRFSRPWMIALIVLALLVGGYATYRWVLYRRVQAAVEAVRATGAPVTLRELDASYVKPPPHEDATDLVLEALALPYEPSDDVAGYLPGVGAADEPEPWESVEPYMLAAMDKYLAEKGYTLRLLHRAGARGHARWPTDLTRESTVPSYLLELTRASSLLTLDALAGAAHGDADRVIRALESFAGTARCIHEEPLLISQLRGAGYVIWATSAAAQALHRMALDDAQLARIERALEAMEPKDGMRRALVGERCCHLAATQPQSEYCAWYAGQNLGCRVETWRYELLGLRQLDQLFLMNDYRAMIDIFSLPVEERWPAFQAYKAGRRPPGAHLIVSSELYEGVWEAPVIELLTIARLRVARAAVVVERYRLENGQPPEDGDTITPRLPLDPFSAKAIGYRRTSDGFVTFSVGRDGVNDPDAPTRDMLKDGDKTVVFEVRRASE